MKGLLIGAAIWTGVVVAAVVFVPWDTFLPPDLRMTSGCWRLVAPPPGCMDQLANLNDRRWWTLTLPLLVFISSGYVVLAILAVRRRHGATPRDIQRR